MRTYLLPKDGQFYKADLHCHTKVSDGRNTAEEMKEYYKSKGYSILAITDHELLVDHTHLSDEDFLILTGYEYAFIEREKGPYKYVRTLELNLYAKDPHNVTQVCFHPGYIIHGEKWRADEAKYVGELYERKFTIESIQKVVDTAIENGFLVSVNHPHFSMLNTEFFGQLKGIFAMEIHNQGYHLCDYNPQMYDQMLRMGHRISCIAADDAHKAFVYDSKEDPRPWGFSMIKAEKLDYDTIMKAIENGDFYASQGPEIYELYTEDNKVYIRCSDAKRIVMQTKYRNYEFKEAPCGEFINDAEFKIPDDDEYMRFSVTDAYGRVADTRAYFLK